MLVFILLLSEGRAGEIWEPSKQAMLFRIWGTLGMEVMLRNAVTLIIHASYLPRVYEWNFRKI
jgi:hypothetical protein